MFRAIAFGCAVAVPMLLVSLTARATPSQNVSGANTLAVASACESSKSAGFAMSHETLGIIAQWILIIAGAFSLLAHGAKEILEKVKRLLEHVGEFIVWFRGWRARIFPKVPAALPIPVAQPIPAPPAPGP